MQFLVTSLPVPTQLTQCHLQNSQCPNHPATLSLFMTCCVFNLCLSRLLILFYKFPNNQQNAKYIGSIWKLRKCWRLSFSYQFLCPFFLKKSYHILKQLSRTLAVYVKLQVFVREHSPVQHLKRQNSKGC